MRVSSCGSTLGLFFLINSPRHLLSINTMWRKGQCTTEESCLLGFCTWPWGELSWPLQFLLQPSIVAPTSNEVLSNCGHVWCKLCAVLICSVWPWEGEIGSWFLLPGLTKFYCDLEGGKFIQSLKWAGFCVKDMSYIDCSVRPLIFFHLAFR